MKPIHSIPVLLNARSCGVLERRSQQGVVLFFALIALVAMTMAGIALFRSIDSATLIAGNLAFRQGATSSGNAAVETAAKWLEANPTLLIAHQSSNGYYATINEPAGKSDLTGNVTAATPDNFNWAASAVHLATDSAGNTAEYVIHRVCANVGALDPATCSASPGSASGNSVGSLVPNETYQARMSGAFIGYYRVTVKVTGPRNSVSYLQAMVLLEA